MTKRAISRKNAEHYTWGEKCDGWYLVRTEALNIIEERMPAGATEERHYHERARQFFHVLAGELTVEVEGEFLVLQPGEGIEIVPGEKHHVMNRTGEDVRFVLTSVPPSHGDKIPA